jgi:hypothetical protein
MVRKQNYPADAAWVARVPFHHSLSLVYSLDKTPLPVNERHTTLRGCGIEPFIPKILPAIARVEQAFRDCVTTHPESTAKPLPSRRVCFLLGECCDLSAEFLM